MYIRNYRSDPRFANCPNGFVVTGKCNNIETDKLNRKLLLENKTGHWIIAAERVHAGDAIFVLLPSQKRKDGYPREFFGGVVTKLIHSPPDRTIVEVEYFFTLPQIDHNVRNFLLGNVPPQGNTALKVWESSTLETINSSFERSVDDALNDDRKARLKRLEKASRIPKSIFITVKSYIRNPDVVAEVLDQANGVCGDCGNHGPFKANDGRYFLEVHHKHRLSDGGDDSVENAIALCPNCHRKQHYRSAV